MMDEWRLHPFELRPSEKRSWEVPRILHGKSESRCMRRPCSKGSLQKSRTQARRTQGFPASSKTLLSGLFRRPVLLPDQPVFSIGVFEFRDNPVARFFFCRNDQAWLLIVQCCHECVLGSINFNTDRSFCCVGRKDKLVSSGLRESNHSFGDSTAG